MSLCRKCQKPSNRNWCDECRDQKAATLTPGDYNWYHKEGQFIVTVDREPMYAERQPVYKSRFDFYDAMFARLLHNQELLKTKLDALTDRFEFMPAAGEEYDEAKKRYRQNAQDLDEGQ